MFTKILIANRGEIACRIIKTARRMGITTVAVYSEADAGALHVEMADEAVAIGPPPSTQSYLDIGKIVTACRDTGAEAVHPGYGFLSERQGFADALAADGIAFIGPNTRAIAAMGDKIESKKLARSSGVSVVPGFVGEILDDAHARAIAREIGYPVMVKASAGGGGKGLRIVQNEGELLQAIASSKNEARASFGDDRLLIEKYVIEPRHIEIQVMGDRHGNIVHLNERECSIQRRHQKVIEEAPSPFLDAATRQTMGAQAVALARAVDYDSAGTVEFIVDAEKNFYFLEMNTRLQVEHPVTELVTGLDLVELMIRSAAGERLGLAQDDVKLAGSAIEARIYAEDPYRGFLPSTGRLVHYRPPQEGCDHGITLRNDTGVYEGSEISVYYDPMIAKLCTHAPSRTQAIDGMADALDAFRIDGIKHNIPFLAAIMHNSRFRAGRLSTGFIAEEFPDGFHGVLLDEAGKRRFAAAAVAARIIRSERASRISGKLNGALGANDAWIVSIDGEEVPAQCATLEGGQLCLLLKDIRYEAEVNWDPGATQMAMTENGQRYLFQISRASAGYRLAHGGSSLVIAVRRPAAAKLAALMPRKAAADTSKLLVCPMPGLIVSVNVREGQEVKSGETLAVVEAMKMENVLRSERDGVVKSIKAHKGATLAVDDVILEFA